MADATSELPEGIIAVVNLRQPVVRGEQKIASIMLRQANGTVLSGISLFDLMRMDTNEIVKILPRISEPPLTVAEAKLLSGPDLFEIGQELSAFLLL
ncbi:MULTISPECIES: phage tail assembly protein [unclassified Novosphingobium]|uniref:phage tail assembly protein n=1 Tax=unclassified Novosphingobium TaxID=2644732 RepID=UPI000D2FDF5C|nr:MULTISPECIES: phage tail assembly protein [unclassified Novosphingobium]PTR05481.1 hypothetical protein C8K11_13212 [Novosphingobium sp. GV055]PUA94039.1 hypothetical protein C8K12_13212 [Novosphingobium sp. GV061]PUB11626.1 hypothetical protein C8K14_13212 [Novosphingobium sp. GV079]PUB37100.1 hypothetical protein C8K10_13212 [Novosphingobium sp. GV027]